jgi:DNA repair protein RecO (recombination protein O)
MIIKTKGLVLSRMNYRDNDLIVRLYTQEKGLLSLIFKGIRKSRKNRMAYFQPLNILEINIKYDDKKDLQYPGEFSQATKLPNLYVDMVKTSLAFFLAELAYKSLNEHDADPALYHFFEQSVITLDQQEKGLANFHLIFLIQLAQHLGLGIHGNEESMVEIKNCSRETLGSNHISLLKKLIQSNYENSSLVKLQPAERSVLLQSLLDYYYYNLENMSEIKSLEVLESIFQN